MRNVQSWSLRRSERYWSLNSGVCAHFPDSLLNPLQPGHKGEGAELLARNDGHLAGASLQNLERLCESVETFFALIGRQQVDCVV